MHSKTFKNMKIAETISERKESTKESQGEVFEKVMISLPHLGNIDSVLVRRCCDMINQFGGFSGGLF